MSLALETMRAFVAVNVDVASVRKLSEIARSLREDAGAPDVRWVAPTKMHVTLQFLGNIDLGIAPALVDALRPIAAPRAALRAAIAGLSAFPSPEEARVVVALVEDPAGSIADLAQEVERRVRDLGFPREARTYRPHVTLARTRAPLDARRWLAAGRATLPEIQITEIVLYRSDAARSGAEYTAVARFPLG